MIANSILLFANSSFSDLMVNIELTKKLDIVNIRLQRRLKIKNKPEYISAVEYKPSRIKKRFDSEAMSAVCTRYIAEAINTAA